SKSKSYANSTRLSCGKKGHLRRDYKEKFLDVDVNGVFDDYEEALFLSDDSN
ncbi:hypothetical protein Droror1_Dr00025521, partial [Drosera rotundifolia]